ncbi:MAG: enoyl-CoA hydratase/isomerase family protein [Xanthomonadaceae bacterium]|jgi:enoyl-CoA hydratase/carnithine racemase|nr:enoyl-CoA hydratase/isomerase family protein [Xanthomonadaceae bacterium]
MSGDGTDHVVNPEAPVLFEETRCGNGTRIGIATLNAPVTLNSLSLEMVDLLDARLRTWAEDGNLALVVLRGSGDKAFCAGGDLRNLYRSMGEHAESGNANPAANRYASGFFAREYRLDYRLHSYSKPILCWGHGIVMGGGMGLMAGASHRVVTEKSRLAMPEIGIGLFPDVGGSWILNHVPGRTGRFLALTGAALNAADALYAGLADFAIAHAGFQGLLTALTEQAWSRDRMQNDHRLTELLRRRPLPLSSGPLQLHRQQIDDCCGHATPDATVAAIAALAADDPWIARAQAALAAGCPGSMRLAWELLERSSRLSLAEVFRLEYTVGLHCAAHGDFREGIRALLIDKDKTPHWQPRLLAQADSAWAELFFTPSWPPGAHPLADLGRDDPQRRNLQ